MLADSSLQLFLVEVGVLEPALIKPLEVVIEDGRVIGNVARNRHARIINCHPLNGHPLSQTLVIFLIVVVVGIETCFWDLHADQNFVPRIVLPLDVLHLKEAIKDALQGLNFVDCF